MPRHGHQDARGTDEPHAATPIQFTQMLVPIDFSVCSLDALEYGIQFAKDCGESLTLLHILEPIAYSVDLMLTQTWEQNRNEVDAHMNALVNNVGAHGVSVRGMILGGLPADSILETVRAIDADLIVMGTHGRRGISHVIQGSVAEAVLRRAPCPVLAMKNLAFAPDHQRVIPTMGPIVPRSEYGPSPEKRSG